MELRRDRKCSAKVMESDSADNNKSVNKSLPSYSSSSATMTKQPTDKRKNTGEIEISAKIKSSTKIKSKSKKGKDIVPIAPQGTLCMTKGLDGMEMPSLLLVASFLSPVDALKFAHISKDFIALFKDKHAAEMFWK